MKRILITVCTILLSMLSSRAAGTIPTDEIVCRDPFIFADEKSSTYYLYRSASVNMPDGSVVGGVEAFWSKDLRNWDGPKQVMTLRPDNWISGVVWAPEVHMYKGRYYIFATVNSNIVWKGGNNNGKPYVHRAVQIFRANSPEGPFEAMSDVPCTPLDYMALDGTLYVEDSIPYMVFCREWVQIGDGTIEMMPLKKDLSKANETPTVLFHATASRHFKGFIDKSTGRLNCVTDACFLYKSKTGRLFMLWSSSGSEKNCYCVAAAYSSSGKIRGPWIQCDDLLANDNGGHAMVFKGFDGQLYIVYHRPNGGSPAHPCIFRFIDNGDAIGIGEQIA